ncbi:hypothetical protein TNCV_4622781 [Trichonephila clavipes]|nr:hypothetical protein TNCV_4622781 [Trichonephila clavipes]
MYRLLAVACILVFILGLPGLNGYRYFEYLNTDNGYCESEGLERIPVGENRFSDKYCELIVCTTAYRRIEGCRDAWNPRARINGNNCTLVKGEGRYPDCCPYYKCEEGAPTAVAYKKTNRTEKE